jgi:hypothetical protein
VWLKAIGLVCGLAANFFRCSELMKLEPALEAGTVFKAGAGAIACGPASIVEPK